jgi:hypothetical protein
VRLGFIFDDKTDASLAGELASARLFGVKMIKARFAGYYFSVFGYLQPLGK